jgi:hypothetical protein
MNAFLLLIVVAAHGPSESNALEVTLDVAPAGVEAADGEQRDATLFRSAGLREHAKDLQGAIALREQLRREFPESTLAAPNLWALAQSYEALADFDRAAEAYEAYPHKAERARDAQLNAGLLRVALGQCRPALENQRRFLEDWPTDPEAENVMLSIADLHATRCSTLDGIAVLEEYARSHRDNALAALGDIAKLQRPADAKRTYARITAAYGEARPSTPAGREALARAKLVAAEEDFARYAKLKVRGANAANPVELKRSIREKMTSLQRLEQQYTAIIALGQGGPGLCALYKIGTAYELAAKALDGPYTPADLSFAAADDGCKLSAPLWAKAAEPFRATVMKSHELGEFNECSAAAGVKLYGALVDEVPEIRLDLKPQMQGLGPLLEIQPASTP